MNTGMTRSTQRATPARSTRGPLASLRDEMQELFGDFWGDGDGNGMRMLAPRLDISEADDALQVSVDLPGLEAKDIDVQVVGNQLTISGERKSESEEKNETFHRIERSVGRFSRSIALPCSVDEDKIDATYSNGVLSISLPKTEEAKAHRITVKSSGEKEKSSGGKEKQQEKQ